MSLIDTYIYKISPRVEWEQAIAQGIYDGSDVDQADGFIHFSTAQTVAETAAKHFRGQSGLVLIAFDPADFGEALKWEPSRGGQLFPHLYDRLDPRWAIWLEALELDSEGCPIIPEIVGKC